MSDFSFLYLHTHFSRGGGPASPAEWCKRAAQLGYSALAIADRGPLSGIPAFVEAAQHSGLTPVCGAEIDVLLPLEGGRKTEPVAIPAVLFARDSVGMANLSGLCTLAYGDWPALEAPVEWEALCKHAEGLVIALIVANDTGIPSALLDLPLTRLTELGSTLKEHFGDGAFVGLPGDYTQALKTASCAEQMALPVVAMPAARYIPAKDAPSYGALRLARAGAGWGKDTAGDKQGSLGNGEEYLRSQSEAVALFNEWPEAVGNIARVVEMCSRAGSEAWGARSSGPELAVEGVTLKQMAERRLLSLLAVDTLPGAIEERLDAEVMAAVTSGRVQAWLALGLIVEAARANRVPLGAPLGMADGALLSYALGVSSLNPMQYATPPWFLTNAETPSMPGVEVPSGRRDMLVAALAKEYGWERIAHAACVVDITPIAAAQASLAALHTSGDDGRLLLAGVIEKGWAAFNEDTALVDGKPGPGTLAASLRGAPIFLKADPDTLVIMPPSQRSGAAPGGSFYAPHINISHSSEGQWVPWSEEVLCSHAYPAFSLRPMRALTVLDNALTIAAKYPTPGFVGSSADPSIYPQPDEAITASVLALITKGEVTGIPLFTSKAAKGWKEGLTSESMAALVAHSLARHKIQNPKVTLQEGDTSRARNLEGAWLYRDQGDTLLELAELSYVEAATLRRSLLKPDLDTDGALRARLVDGCVQYGLSEDSAKALRDAFLASGHAPISRHVAHAWGRIALWSAVIKAGHPAALFAGALAVAWEGGVRSTVGAIIAEARRLDIGVLPPDVNRSGIWPSLERDGGAWAIMWGLALLPGWSREDAERFVEGRPSRGISTLRELALLSAETGMSGSHVEGLVQSGACDLLGGQPRDRSALVEALGPMLEWAQALIRTGSKTDLFAATDAPEPPIDDVLTVQTGKPSPGERSIYRSWEEANLGAAFTGAQEMATLRQAMKVAGDLQARLLATSQIATGHLGQSVFVVGILSGVQLLPSGEDGLSGGGRARDDLPMAVAQVEDIEGSIELVAFPPNYKRHKELWVESNMVIITARVSAHADGVLYLLCEHMVPFEGNNSQEELSFKVKTGRSAARASDTPSDVPDTTSAKGILAQTQVVAVPKSTTNQTGATAQPMYAQTAAQANGNGNGSGATNGTGNGYSNGHSTQNPGHNEGHNSGGGGAPTYKLIISLPISEDDHTDIDTMLSLNDILAAHPGSDIVLLRIPYSLQPEAVTFAHLPRGARYSSHLEAKLSRLLGPEALAVIKLQD